jgi:hypothetical protein
MENAIANWRTASGEMGVSYAPGSLDKESSKLPAGFILRRV